MEDVVIRQNLIQYAVITLIFVLGVIAGVNLSTTVVVRAQTKNSVYVTHVKEGKKEAQDIPGEVIGFSCTAGGANRDKCFVLSH